MKANKQETLSNDRGGAARVLRTSSPLLTSTGSLHEVVLDVDLFFNVLVLLLQLRDLHHVELVAEQASHTTEASYELSALLALVGDELEGEALLRVVLSKPLN